MVVKHFSMPRVEDTPEFQSKDLEKRFSQLPNQTQTHIIRTLIVRVCYYGPATQEWMEQQIAEQERLLNRQKQKSSYTANDHPTEDMFGSEIQTGDKWFQDKDGRIVLEDNAEDYLIEVVGVEFFRELT